MYGLAIHDPFINMDVQKQLNYFYRPYLTYIGPTQVVKYIMFIYDFMEVLRGAASNKLSPSNFILLFGT